jgi:general secretion pathway protein A
MLIVAFIALSLRVNTMNPVLNWMHSSFTGTQPKAIDIAATSSKAESSSAVGGTSISPVLSYSTLQHFSGTVVDDSEASALRSLFKLYGIDIDIQPGDSSCQLAEVHNVSCYAGNGGLADLFLLDQPVLLRLFSRDGKLSSATLIAMDRKTVTILVDGLPRQLSLVDLANEWSGQFVAILNVPPDFKSEILPLQRRQSVAWLRQMMERSDGIHSDGSELYDDDLVRRVRVFQITEGIQPNGIVDPVTVIRLNVRNGKGALPLFAKPKS